MESEANRAQREMERILAHQADPARPSPLAERWSYLDAQERARQQAAVMSDIQWLRLAEKNAEFERRMR